MLKKVKTYFGEIKEAEKLERRSLQKWEEQGTMEEALKVFKLQKRKKRNNAIAVATYLTGFGGLLAYANHESTKQIKQQKQQQQDEAFYNQVSEADVIIERNIELLEEADEQLRIAE